MTFDEWWKKETDDNENNVDDWKGFCKTAFEAGQKEVKQLGERCNQLLKDKGYLTDKLQELKEILAQTIENDEVAYETLKLHDQEEIGMLNSKVAGLGNKIADLNMKIDGLEEQNSYMFNEITLQEQQIEKMKCCGNCIHRHYWGNELGCNLDLDKQFECDNNNKKYWEFREE